MIRYRCRLIQLIDSHQSYSHICGLCSYIVQWTYNERSWTLPSHSIIEVIYVIRVLWFCQPITHRPRATPSRERAVEGMAMGNCSGGLWHCCGEGDLEPWRGSGGKVRRSTLRWWKTGGAGAEWLKCQNEVGRCWEDLWNMEILGHGILVYYVYIHIYIYGMYCVWYVNVCDIWYVVFYGIIMVWHYESRQHWGITWCMAVFGCYGLWCTESAMEATPVYNWLVVWNISYFSINWE
jgi:hypothetical protein